MDWFLRNPVYSALQTGDAHLRFGTDKAAFFHEEVSPFVGFSVPIEEGFAELHHLLPKHRNILYATTRRIVEPFNWEVKHEIEGLQFLFSKKDVEVDDQIDMQLLTEDYVEEMKVLAALTKPGPFGNAPLPLEIIGEFFRKAN